VPFASFAITADSLSVSNSLLPFALSLPRFLVIRSPLDGAGTNAMTPLLIVTELVFFAFFAGGSAT
jgi:hypothetical protein